MTDPQETLCADCNGRGDSDRPAGPRSPWKYRPCTTCGGMGEVRPGLYWRPCPDCAGTPERKA